MVVQVHGVQLKDGGVPSGAEATVVRNGGLVDEGAVEVDFDVRVLGFETVEVCF